MFFELCLFLSMRYALCSMRSAVLYNGAVAQLGERQNRTLEADGSIPFCSTNNYEGLFVSHPLNDKLEQFIGVSCNSLIFVLISDSHERCNRYGPNRFHIPELLFHVS